MKPNQFSLRQLFGAVFCFAIGCFAAVVLAHTIGSDNQFAIPIETALIVLCGASFGSGIGFVVGNLWKGASLGTLVAVGFLLITGTILLCSNVLHFLKSASEAKG